MPKIVLSEDETAQLQLEILTELKAIYQARGPYRLRRSELAEQLRVLAQGAEALADRLEQEPTVNWMTESDPRRLEMMSNHCNDIFEELTADFYMEKVLPELVARQTQQAPVHVRNEHDWRI